MALTWQNVSPSNPAGILQAGNMAAASIAKGLSTVGDSMQQYAGDTKDAETGKLLLMLDNAKDRNERQSILETADRAYIDESIIAKDNQAFDAAEDRRKATADNREFQQWQRNDAAEKAKLQLGYRTEDVTRQNLAAQNLKTQQDRIYELKTDADKKTDDERIYQRELNKINENRKLLKAEQEGQLFTRQREIQGFELDEQKRLKENIDAGEVLIGGHQKRLTDISASVPDLVTYWSELDTKEIGGVKAAKALKEQVATQLYKQIDRFDVFGEGVTISSKLRSVTEGTIQKNKANHKYNIKVFSDRLRNTLPGVINAEQLSSMSERMLNNVIMSEEGTYGDVASNLSKTADDLQQDKIDIVKNKLFIAGEDKIIDQTEYTALDNYIKNTSNFNNDTRPVRAELRTILETAVDKQFKDTQLLTDDPANYINALRKGAMGEGGLLNKNKVKTNNNELVQKLINAEMKRAKSFGINEKEVRAQIKEQLSNIPEYNSELVAAGISWEDELKQQKALENITARQLGNSAKTPEQINKAITYHKDTQLAVPENLTNKLNTSVEDNAALIIEEKGLGIDGRFEVEVVDGKQTFNFNTYNTWSEGVRDAIKEEYPDVPETILNKVIGKIVTKDSFLTKSLDMHNRTVNLLKELAETTDTMKVARSKSELTKKEDFEENPRLYLYEHTASSGAIGDILGNLKSKGNESENIDNYNKTARNIQEVANRVYEVLHTEHNVGKPKGITTNELRILAENALSSLKIDTQLVYGNKASFDKMSKEEIIRASAGPIATGGGSKSPNALDTAAIKRLEERLRGIPPRNYVQRKEISNKITEIKEKTL